MSTVASTIKKVPSEIAGGISTLVGLLRRAAFEPTITGSLLLALTKSPPKLRAKLFEYLPALADDRRLAHVIRTLKVLVWLGLASRVNSVLSALAENHWQIRRTGTPWDFSENKEIAVITGGSSGFGLLMAKGLSDKAKVVVLDVQDLPEKIPNVSFYRCDVSSNASIHEAAAAIRNDIGNPSILINNAGVAGVYNLLNSDDDRVEKVFKVNIISHFTLIKEFLPAMLENKKGHIVEIASTASYLSGTPLIDYCASKAGVLSLYEGLNGELRFLHENGTTIQTSIVHPTWHSTPLIAPYEAAVKAKNTYIGPPNAVSDAVIRQVLSGRGRQVFVPESYSRLSLKRALPVWVQEVLRSMPGHE